MCRSSLLVYPCRFFVINQRFDIAFYYFKNIKSTNGSVPAYTSAGVVAQTPRVANKIAYGPTQTHLTFSGIPGCGSNPVLRGAHVLSKGMH